LTAEIDAHLAGVSTQGERNPRALIAPHAGLMYSGPVAAHAYTLIERCHYDAVVLVGPSHFVGFEGVSIWPDGAWGTPFGDVPIANGLAAAIASETHVVSSDAAPHAREHSLEMQLPFLARLLPGVPIVPLVMGHQTRDTADALGDAIGRAVTAFTANTGQEVLLVASSDLSHFLDAVTAARMDRTVLECVEAFDPDALMVALERQPHHACGGGPIVSVLRAARQLGAMRARVLHYGDSGDVSGDKSSVVGYMAAAAW